MTARIADIEGEAEQVRARSSKLEKERNKLQIQINETMVELESVRIKILFLKYTIQFQWTQFFLSVVTWSGYHRFKCWSRRHFTDYINFVCRQITLKCLGRSLQEITSTCSVSGTIFFPEKGCLLLRWRAYSLELARMKERKAASTIFRLQSTVI